MNYQLYNKPVYLKFTDSTWTSSAYISVAFPVKQIRIVQILFQDDLTFNNYFTSNKSGALLISDLVGNNVLGVVSTGTYDSRNTTHFSTVLNPIQYEYRNAIKIDNTYSFQLRDMDGINAFTGNYNPANNYEMCVMIEFTPEMLD